MNNFVSGQRWMSQAEPELGLGTLIESGNRRLSIGFPASGVVREYSLSAAPLKRVCFKIGDTVCLKDNSRVLITGVSETNGLVEYSDGNRVFSETELSDIISFSLPQDRLFAGLADRSSAFDLRYRTLCLNGRYLLSPARGFLGGQIDLVPHQFYIAGEVTSRYLPRVLLSDETGLGKTIEACLILHQLLTCERIGRVLIIVPESLVHQWFVELYRKFNLSFRIFNEALITEATLSASRMNPFLNDQLGICSLGFIRRNRKIQNQILQAGWDMVVVDEAHHVDHTKEEYSFFLELGKRTRGMMLLTATPEQMGFENHFSHLKLLDPERYYDFDAYMAELDSYRILAGTIKTRQKKHLPVDHILDSYGPGRVIFKNTRAHIKGFPKRKGILYPLETSMAGIQESNLEFSMDLESNGVEPADSGYRFSNDPRIKLLAKLLQDHKQEKFLLICSSMSKVTAIKNALESIINISVARFDETMTLLQRDRNAAWFSQKDGARILICSEIGSEGRNFQFSHHLFLFDLPLNPELLEQRIGRLDRIGQKHDIRLHVPYIKNSSSEILAQWYMKGLNLFETNLNGAHHIFSQFKSRLSSLFTANFQACSIDSEELEQLIDHTRVYCRQVKHTLEKGKNILLEMNSFKPDKAFDLIRHIHELDKDTALENLLISIFESYDIDSDPKEKRTYVLRFNEIADERFPLPDTVNTVKHITFDRQKAVEREDIDFINLDHPYTTRVLEFYTGMGTGNCAVAKLREASGSGLLLESVYLPECISPPELELHRFLPAVPVRCVISHRGDDMTLKYPFDALKECLEPDTPAWLNQLPEIKQALIPDLLKQSARIVSDQMSHMIHAGKESIRQVVGKEITRLSTLKKINQDIKQSEIDLARIHLQTLLETIDSARLRLDSLRVIRT